MLCRGKLNCAYMKIYDHFSHIAFYANYFYKTGSVRGARTTMEDCRLYNIHKIVQCIYLFNFDLVIRVAILIDFVRYILRISSYLLNIVDSCA